ncbi:Tad domain-containing protein [Pseudalkalibacillus berkeleyi]|uniref:Pilus assembly protein TadG-related protein n=1 Tax=Pseudalkalibacillus berkeleyi TaxID=1069813 RepID=A0ABS9GWV6_9BACL|nr:Tad domain-containing protein [Pseudalkalibacillus berkeleyi]MCF6137282.1 pilus assembly protein TadG-related protein [Pseudalkalibacillus berkeleyi]
MKKIKQLPLQNEHGSVIVFISLGLVILFGIAAIAIDGGRLYFEKSKVQSAVDAAVLAGAQQIPISSAAAVTTAIEVASDNGYSLLPSDIKVEGKFISATITQAAPMTFAKVLGFHTVNVPAKAKARIGPLEGGTNIIPIGIPEYGCGFRYLESYQLNLNPNIRGNFGYLAVDGRGASNLKDGIINGIKLSIGETVLTEPGGKVGPVSQAISTRIAADNGKAKCSVASTADNSCKRVVYVPIVDGFPNVNGRSSVTIVGFAAFWLEEIQNKIIYGKFIKAVESGEIGETGTDDFGLYAVKLVN